MQPAPATRPSRRSRLGSDLLVLGLVGALLLAALGAGGLVLYREFYSPSAFVSRYLSLLSDGRASDALRVPGVAVDRSILSEAGIDGGASDALLRQAALAPLNDVEILSEETEGQDVLVTAAYAAGPHHATTTFRVRQSGWIGVAPNWRFSQSPLSVVSLTVRGSDRFAVNGFEIDRRQVAAEGVDSSPLDPVSLLVFSPGLYSVSVDTATARASGVSVLADAPLATVPVDVQTEPTEEFVAVVQERVDEFLTQCATQQVLQPTGCPFGYPVQNRITEPPVWSIVAQPTVALEPDGANWRIPATEAVARIEVEIRSLFDGSVHPVDEEVPFLLEGTVTMLADGSASIRVGSPDDPQD